MKGVTRVFDHLGHLDAGSLDLSRAAGVQSGYHIGATRIIGANDSKRRVVKVVNGRGLPHELRIHANTEFIAAAFGGNFLEQRHDYTLNGSWQHSAANANDMESICFAN